MTLSNYRKTFLIRFLAYSFILTGLTTFVFEFGPLVLSEARYRSDQLTGVQHSLPNQIITSGNDATASGRETSFGSLDNTDSQIIKPVSTDYGIVIEKINANARVIPNVDPGNSEEYAQALTQGVAEAKGSTKPGENGNLFIFSHSADAPWNIIRFNAIFYLLRELKKGDRVSIFYKGRRYDYIVFDKTIVPPKDTSLLTNRYDSPVLTLQTCDPPGTLINRLIVRAKLAGT